MVVVMIRYSVVHAKEITLLYNSFPLTNSTNMAVLVAIFENPIQSEIFDCGVMASSLCYTAE
jgi:hypothetical protein